jgi:uncharacterized protein
MKTKFYIIFLVFLLVEGYAQSYVPTLKNKYIKVAPSVKIQAYAFNLKDVKINSGSPFHNAMTKDANYLALLEPNRLLHRFYLNAGLPTKGAVYGGWESDGVSGHTLGHYLSASSMMYASIGDKAFKERVGYIVKELARCQAARKTGYVGAIPKEDTIFGKLAKGEIKTSGFDMNGGWSPWYTVHKVMAGLFDAYLYCDDKLALQVLKGMADWTSVTLSKLTEEQIQLMLKCEWGGMNDILASLYAVTGEKKYLDLSYKFYDDFVMKPLSERIDPLPGKHSNTNVPKAIGSATQYEVTGNEKSKTIAKFFWETMTHNHSYVIGGNSNYEYCGEPGKLNDRLSDNTCETCNTYNMLKLTRHLFTWEPSSELGDYYERALYNHILASQHPESGMMTYFVPLRMGTRKMFSDSFNTFTCCVGSGLENHSKYGEHIYYEGADGSLFVNLFIPSTLNWVDKKVQVTQVTDYPNSDIINLKITTKKPQQFNLKIRKPWWAKDGIALKINGRNSDYTIDKNGFIVIARKWQNGDDIELKMPMELYTESMPDNKDRIAFLYGPLVLAGQLGMNQPDPVEGVPVLLTDSRSANTWTKKTTNDLVFETNNVGVPFDLKLIPFYKMYKEYYAVYWDYFTKEMWEQKKQEYENEKKALKELESKTIDNFRIGEMQPERDHKLFATERSYVSDALGVYGREARRDHYFSFEMKAIPSTKNALVFTYIGDDKDRKFDILVNDEVIKTEVLNGGTTGKFFNIQYSIPPHLIKSEKILVKVNANYGKTAGRVFGARTIAE